MKHHRRPALIVFCLAALAAGGCTRSDQEHPAVYDTSADATAQIDSALATAKGQNKRVLLVLGGNWCGWCIKLHHLFHDQPSIAQVLKEAYIVVPVDTGQLDKHKDLAAEYLEETRKHGVPFLAVMDADGKILVKQNTGDLEQGSHHDAAKVEAFLRKWSASAQANT